MTHLYDLPLKRLGFFVTSIYPCSYLPNKMARSLVATPSHLVDSAIYSDLIATGFRRSGIYTYRPHCDHCQACTPVRLKVQELVLSRAQKRAWRRHERLEARMRPLGFDRRHYTLYERYQRARHREEPGASLLEQYQQFLLRSNVATEMVEFWEEGHLRMVSVVDKVTDGLSAVYTFYDPDVPGASYGTYNILWQARWCQEQNLPYLYLGYWIESSAKMAYKIRFRPLERLEKEAWVKAG